MFYVPYIILGNGNVRYDALVEVGNKVTCNTNIHSGISLLQLPTESVRLDAENSYAVSLNLFI
jgi:hypothetical protein